MKKRFEKSTKELQDILSEAGRKTALEQYLKDIKAADGDLVLKDYLNEIIAKKGIALSDVVKNSGFDKGYVYNIFGGHRKNPDKMKLVGICIGCHMTFAETQRALEITECGVLYPRDPADAIIIYNINKENWSVIDINEQLYEHGLPLIGEKKGADK